MKKFLFSTTALAVAGAFAFGADANAAAKPIKIGVGGFMTSEAGFGSNSGSFESVANGTLTKRDSFNTVQDSEIYFKKWIIKVENYLEFKKNLDKISLAYD